MAGIHRTLLALILALHCSTPAPGGVPSSPAGGGWATQPLAEPLSLWYRQPARQWVEALAVGNGRLGAMVFGGVAQERLQLNEDTLWAGGPYDPANPEALEALPTVRELIFAGRYREAHKLVGQKLPALPQAWPSGSVTGLRARGGFELDLQWQDSKLANVTVRSRAGGSCRLRYGAITRSFSLAQGQSVQWDGIN